jgi:acetate kinase
MTGETLYTDGGRQTASSSRPASAKNSPKIRAAVAERLARLGVSRDLAANAEGGTVISRPDRIPLYVLPTDEELMIARHTLALLTKGSKQQRFEKAS